MREEARITDPTTINAYGHDLFVSGKEENNLLPKYRSTK
jgi:hypothetical protein